MFYLKEKHGLRFFYVNRVTLKIFRAAGDSTTPEAVAFVQSDLDVISQWAAANELPISLPKCCTLHYGARSSRHQYILGG